MIPVVTTKERHLETQEILEYVLRLTGSGNSRTSRVPTGAGAWPECRPGWSAAPDRLGSVAFGGYLFGTTMRREEEETHGQDSLVSQQFFE